MNRIGTTEILRKPTAGEISLRGVCRSGLLAVFLSAALAAAGSPANAGVIGAPTGQQGGSQNKDATAKSRSSLELLKAQMNAFKDGLENLNQVKQFFEKDRPGRAEILRDAQQLIKTLPQTEKAGDAAWRIAAIASLATSAGQLSDLQISDDFNLSGGAVGWDFGAAGSPVQRGFTPVTPETLKLDGAEGNIVAVNGETALTDGINAPAGFKTSLPNGMYRILIVADPAADEGDGKNPFGNRITINGAPIGANDVAGTAPLTQRNLGGESGDKVAALGNPAVTKTAHGLGIEGWVIVRDGQLDIDFQGLPPNRKISAIVAEPIDLNKMELTPTIADALATAFSGLEPSAGPDAPRGGFAPRSGLAGKPQGSSGGQGAANGGNGPRSSVAPVAAKAPAAPRQRAPFINAFGNRRPQQIAAGAGPETPVVQTIVDAPLAVVQGPTGTPDDFFDRQTLVKHIDGDEDNSQGVAKDLGNLLDNGSGTGTFLCDEAPCDFDEFTEITDEPDLTAAAGLLEDWLSDAANLDSWDEITAVLESWAPGSEIALVYEFDIAADLWTDVEFRGHTDGGILIWIDGVFVYGSSGPNSATDQAGYDYHADFPDLASGTHVLQIILESHGETPPTVNFELRGNAAGNTQSATTNAVPEPAAMALFGLGLAGLIVIRRRKARA